MDIEMQKIKKAFITKSLIKNPFLIKYLNDYRIERNDSAIDDYFKKLLGENYVH